MCFLSSPSAPSHTLLQDRDWKCLHHFPCWLCFHHHHFSKDLPLPCLSCWLHASFDLADARNGKHPSALHFLCCNFCKVVQDLSTHALLHLRAGGQCFCNATLGHGPH